MQEDKQEYLKNNGFIEFDKQEIKKELIAESGFTEEKAQEWVNKYKYYRLMSDGQKMYYNEEYIDNHTIQELEDAFQKMF